MRLSSALEDKKLDLRLRDKLLHEGKLSKKDIDQYLASLPDDTDNAGSTSQEEEKSEANSSAD